MKRTGVLTAALLLALLLAALLAAPVSAVPDAWSEDWEYGAVHEVGTAGDGWQSRSAQVFTTAAQAHSGSYSVPIDVASWIVHEFSPVPESGEWLLSAWLYVPGGGQTEDTDASTSLVWNADATTEAGTTVFSTWIGAAQYKTNEFDSAPLVRDAWAQFRAQIDLDANHVTVTYNGVTLFDGPYTASGTPRLFSLQIWGITGNAGTIYVDDLSLTPLPGPPAALKHEACLGLEAVLAGLTDPAQLALVRKALAGVRQSLNPAWWADDSHLCESSGSRVFACERSAVADLAKAVRRFRLEPAVVAPVVADLVAADQSLAATALIDARAAGGKPGLIRLAARLLAAGDCCAARGVPLGAIDAYRLAWRSAVSAY